MKCPHCHKQIDDPQVFPWDGRERFIFEHIPHLIALYPGQTYSFYLDAAILSTRRQNLRVLLPESQDEAFAKFACRYPWFPDEQKIRYYDIRHCLCEEQIAIDEQEIATLLIPPKDQLNPPVIELLNYAIAAAKTMHGMMSKSLVEGGAK